MRIHVQNAPGDALFAITPAQVEAALARAGQPPYQVSFADTDVGFADGIAAAEILIGTPASFAKRFPCAAPDLKIICCAAAGMDKLMPLDWLPPDVALLNNRGAHGAKALEYAGMALLMLNVRLPAAIAAQQAGQWQPHFTSTLRGRQVSVIGVGDLGSAAARAARVFGAKVTGVRARPGPHPDFDRTVATDALDTVLPATELLVLACPLTAATRNLMDRRRLGLLPPGAGVVNIGRGALLDQEALCDLLDAERLSGAVLDVFTPEPIPPGHRLWTTRNLVVTPHVSADDPQRYNPDSLDIFFRNLRAWQAGETLPNRVDPERGY